MAVESESSRSLGAFVQMRRCWGSKGGGSSIDFLKTRHMIGMSYFEFMTCAYPHIAHLKSSDRRTKRR